MSTLYKQFKRLRSRPRDMTFDEAVRFLTNRKIGFELIKNNHGSHRGLKIGGIRLTISSTKNLADYNFAQIEEALQELGIWEDLINEKL